MGTIHFQEISVKIGIISDTHDHQRHIRKAIELFNERQVEVVFHAGDLISPFVATAFGGLAAQRFIAVYGNNDGEKLNLRTAVEKIGGEIHEYCYKGAIADKSLYMTHTEHNITEIVASQMYDLVIYGHTHKQDIRNEGRTLVINPGEATDWFGDKSDIVVLESDDLSYDLIPLN